MYELIRLIVEFFCFDLPDELHREHEEKYGIPGQGVGAGKLRKAMFILTAVIIAVLLLALPVVIFAIHEG